LSAACSPFVWKLHGEARIHPGLRDDAEELGGLFQTGGPRTKARMDSWFLRLLCFLVLLLVVYCITPKCFIIDWSKKKYFIIDKSPGRPAPRAASSVCSDLPTSLSISLKSRGSDAMLTKVPFGCFDKVGALSVTDGDH